MASSTSFSRHVVGWRVALQESAHLAERLIAQTCANDHTFSGAQFRALKHRPEFPDRFGSLEHARGVSRDLFAWYNDAHHHSGLSYLTPADVHYYDLQVDII